MSRLQKKKKRCECGNPATVVLSNELICRRCYDIDSTTFHHAEYTWDKPRLGPIYTARFPGIDNWEWDELGGVKSLLAKL